MAPSVEGHSGAEGGEGGDGDAVGSLVGVAEGGDNDEAGRRAASGSVGVLRLHFSAISDYKIQDF